MFKRKMLLIGISLLLLIGLVGVVAVRAQASETDAEDDPWLQKPVLPYLLLTEDERLEREAQALFEALRLSEEEEKTLLEIAVDEQQEMRDLYQQSQTIVQDESRSSAEKQAAVGGHNEGVAEVTADTDRAARQLLGARYPAFRDWIRGWWEREQQAIVKLKQPQGGVGTRSDAYSCWVFATQYNGYTNYEVALPDKYVKFANLGWYIPPPYDARYNKPPYTASINRESNWVWNVLVREVGPWNIDDNYWDAAHGSNPRRMFSDIPLCWSEAEYAYYYGYNGGKDQFGRTVTVPCSVDLTPDVAADLGLGYLENSWLTVYYYDLP
jgi:hypothetical protein